jgi:hypothetical protein
MPVYNGILASGLGATPATIIKNPRTFDANTSILLGLIATISSGASLTYSVQVTADPPENFQNWNNHDVLVNQTASANGNVAYPITGIRLNVTAYASGSVNLGVAQW